jgi:hypothetical protein
MRDGGTLRNAGQGLPAHGQVRNPRDHALAGQRPRDDADGCHLSPTPEVADSNPPLPAKSMQVTGLIAERRSGLRDLQGSVAAAGYGAPGARPRKTRRPRQQRADIHRAWSARQRSARGGAGRERHRVRPRQVSVRLLLIASSLMQNARIGMSTKEMGIRECWCAEHPIRRRGHSAAWPRRRTWCNAFHDAPPNGPARIRNA